MSHQRPLFSSTLRGLVAAFSGDLVLKLFGIAATFITLQQLDPYQYGLWQLMLSVSVAFGLVTFPGIASMLIADVSREIGAGNLRRANGIAIRAALWSVSLGAIGMWAMIVAAPYIQVVSGINVTELLRLLALSILAIGIKQVYQLVFQSKLQYVHAQVMKTIDRISYFVWIALFLGYMGMAFEGVVYAFVASSFSAIIVYAPYMARMLLASYRDHESTEWRPFVEASWHRGRWALGTDTVNAVTGSLWPWMVGFFLGVEAVGIVSIAMLLTGQVAAFVPVSYVLRSVLPRTVETPERLHSWLTRSMKFSLWGNVVAGVGAFFGAYMLFWFWFPQHLAALPIFAATLMALPMRGTASVAAEWFYATGRQRNLFLVSGVPKLLMFILLPLFLFIGGIIGYVLWYILNSDIILYARLRAIARHAGKRIPVMSLLVPDGSDVELLDRTLILVRSKLRSLYA